LPNEEPRRDVRENGKGCPREVTEIRRGSETYGKHENETSCYDFAAI
jgi:hypothetical protein